VRNKDGNMIPLGTLVKIEPAVGASLISLYNLYPSATIVALPAAGVSTGETMKLMGFWLCEAQIGIDASWL